MQHDIVFLISIAVNMTGKYRRHFYGERGNFDSTYLSQQMAVLEASCVLESFVFLKNYLPLPNK